MVCKHKWVFDGIHRVIVRTPEDKFVFVNGLIDNSGKVKCEPRIIVGTKVYNPEKLLFHCEKCAMLKWKKVKE